VRGRLASALAVVLACGCQGLGFPRDCPVEPLDSAKVLAGLRAQGTIRLTQEKTEPTLSFAVEAVDGALIFVAFTAFGTRAFTIEQRGSTLHFDDFLGRHMGVEARWLVDAIHRAYLIPTPEGQRLGQEEFHWRWAGEYVIERSDSDGSVRSRVFSKNPSASDGKVRIQYPGSLGASVGIENPWCGYRARLFFQRSETRDPHENEPAG